METVSNKIKAKKLSKLASRDKLTSPLPIQIKNTNNNRIMKIVCSPNGMGSSLTPNETVANVIPSGIICIHFRGTLLITKAKVTTATCSGIP